MMSCQQVDSLLSAYLEREASPAEVRMVDEHLGSCPRCRAAVKDVAALMDRLSHLPRLAVSEGFTDRVLAEVKGLPAPGWNESAAPRLRPRFLAWGAPLAAAAALVIVAVGALRLSGGPGSDMAMDERVPAPSVLSVEDALRGGREAAAGSDAPSTPPAVATLPELLPGLENPPAEEAKSLGMARDAYVIEDWVLREPTEGGSPVLTRVGADPSASTVVTF